MKHHDGGQARTKFFFCASYKKNRQKKHAQLSTFRKTPSNIIFHGVNSPKLTVGFENRVPSIFHHLRQSSFHRNSTESNKICLPKIERLAESEKDFSTLNCRKVGRLSKKYFFKGISDSMHNVFI